MKSRNSRILAATLVILAAAILVWAYSQKAQAPAPSINSFAECASAGNPILLSYPEQCSANGKTYSNPDQSVILSNP